MGSAIQTAKQGLPIAALFLALLPCVSRGAESTDLARGRYLAIAANCTSCHTRPGGQPFAGGVAFTTPYGVIYSTNITRDRTAGIGQWTRDQFVNALRKGVRPDGQHLYPAFPYPAFTKFTDRDASDLYAYFRTVSASAYVPPANELRFPYNQRWALGLWKMLYFKPEPFKPDPTRSAEFNRGAYLVEGPGHCGACHTPRGFLGAEDSARFLTGAVYKDRIEDRLLDWSTSNLTPSLQGLRAWSVQDIADYLKFGVNPRASVFGPMNEVVLNSTSKLTDQDARAIAVYLKGLKPAIQDSGPKLDQEQAAAGEQLYTVHCGTCHLPTGLGAEDTGPPLAGSPIVLASDPSALINITLYGPSEPHPGPSERWSNRKWQVMGSFGDKLADEEAAQLLSFIRGAWGNTAGEVSISQVAKQRQ